MTPEERKAYMDKKYGVVAGTSTGEYDAASDMATLMHNRGKKQELQQQPQDAIKPPTIEDEKKSWLDKIGGAAKKFGDVSEATLGTAAKFLFGSTGKVFGGAISKGIGGAMGIASDFTGDEKLRETGQKLQTAEEAQASGGDVAFTALELYPGGKFVTEALRKAPGGKQILAYLSTIPDKMKANAIKKYSELFKATSKESKELVTGVVPEMVEQGQKFTSVEKLAGRAEGMATDAGRAIDDWFAALPAGSKTKVKPIIDALSKAQSKYKVGNKIFNKKAYNAFESLKSDIATQSGDIALGNLRKVRQIWDEFYDVSKGIDDISAYTKKAQRAGADAIRAELAKTSPDLAVLNKQFSFWRKVQDLATYTKGKGESIVTKGFGVVAGGAAGAAVGEEFGGSKITGMAVGAFLGKRAIKLFKSPAWKTTTSVTKSKLADAVMKGDMQTVNLIVNRILAGGKNVLDE